MMAAGNEERGDAAWSALEQRAMLPFDGPEPADPGRNEHADARRQVGCDGQVCFIHREL
jgi:hypothetical protein